MSPAERLEAWEAHRDSSALDKVAELLCGEWNADTFDLIALIVRGTGRNITDTERSQA